jgi:cell division protein FtsZ
MRVAESGLAELQKHVDTLIVIPNQNLFRIANENTTFQEAFEMADEVLHSGVRGITDLITSPGLVNLDFADIETVMSEKGKAMMGTGEASGEDRAIRAAEAAIANPLLDQSSMFGAHGVLINITGGKDMTLYEVDSAANRIREEVGDPDANIIFGSTFNSELEGKIRVSVVATGIEHDAMNYVKAADTVIEIKDESSDDIRLANDKYSLTGNHTIEDHQPPTYNEYKDSVDDDEAEIQKKLEQIGKQIYWREEQPPSKIVVTSSSPSHSAIKPEKSLLRRMWNSLNSNEVSENTNHNHGDVLTSAASDKTASVQETPDFLRKR